MTKWLERARQKDGEGCANSAKSAERPKNRAFDTNGTIGTGVPIERQGEVRDAFEERAAICQYDGGLPASHAEVLAVVSCAPLAPGETLEQRDATVIYLADYLDKMRAGKRRAGAR